MLKSGILHVSLSDLGRHGVARVIMDISETLTEYRFDALVMGNSNGDYDEEFKRLGGNIFHFMSYRGDIHLRKTLSWYMQSFRLFIMTYKILKKNGPYKAIHCHNLFESGPCVAAALFAGVKIRISHSHMSKFHGKQSLPRRIVTGFQKFLIKKIATHKIGCSKESAEYLFGTSSNFIVVLNGVDISKFDYRNHKISADRNIRFVHVGRFSHQKNQLFVLEVFAELAKNYPNASLVMVGSGELKKLIINKIEQLKIKDKITLLPHDSDIPKVFSEADYMIFPSRHEGMAITLLEAQSAGVYCFISAGLTKLCDAGLIEYIPLESGCNNWALKIKKYIENDSLDILKIPDSKRLDEIGVKSVVNEYKKIYSTENN